MLLVLCFVLPCGALSISEKSVIVDKEGLVVLSPEEYLGIDPCDRDCSSCDGEGKIKQRKQVYVTD